jgi:hypothetical protein
MKDKKDKKISEKAFLEWKRQDFVDANEEIPNSLMFDDFHTEGELMSEDEIVEWILDTEKTFSIIKQQDETAFNKLYEEYIKDLNYLVKIKKLSKENIEEILNKKNFEF